MFDNHRVARRFSRNKQRVIKVPDGNLIMRTRPYLQAKGITRLLVDGQVFDLARRGVTTSDYSARKAKRNRSRSVSEGVEPD